MYRPASVSFPLPQSPIFFGGDRAKSCSYLDEKSPLKRATNLGESEEEIQKEGKLIRNKKELFILIALSLSYYNALCAFAMIAPIFPLEAGKFNVSTSVQGQIFAVYPLTVFALSPLVGKWMPVMGVKFCLIAGGFVSGGSNLLFGFVGDLGSKTLFTVFCFILRIFMAAGVAFNETAAISIMTITFKHQLATAQGIIAVFTGLGLMSGPSIGGILYQFGNFRTPFIVMGCLVWAVVLMIAFILPPERSYRQGIDDGDDEPGNFCKTIRVPGVFVMSTVTLTAGMILSFLDPTLTNYVIFEDPSLRKKTAITSLIFLCAPLTYTIATPILGRMIDKQIIRGRHASIVGTFMGFVCYLFLAPSPIIGFIKQPHLWLTITSLLAMGCLSVTAMFVPVLADMQISARNAGLPMNLATDSILSGIYTANFYIGSIIGPSLGSVLTDSLNGFRWSSTVFAFALLFEGILLLLFTLWENKYGPQPIEQPRSKKIKWKEYQAIPEDDERA